MGEVNPACQWKNGPHVVWIAMHSWPRVWLLMLRSYAAIRNPWMMVQPVDDLRDEHRCYLMLMVFLQNGGAVLAPLAGVGSGLWRLFWVSFPRQETPLVFCTLFSPTESQVTHMLLFWPVLNVGCYDLMCTSTVHGACLKSRRLL